MSGTLQVQIKEHWRKHRPKMYQDLLRSGKLNESVRAAADLTSDALAEAVKAGQPYDAALEAVREQWAFLPDEEDVPVLGFDPESLPELAKKLPESTTTR